MDGLITTVVSGINYLVHPEILGSIQEQVKPDIIIPILVLDEKDVESGPEELGRILQYYLDHDDVCTIDFTSIIVEKPSRSQYDPIAIQVLASTSAQDTLPVATIPEPLYHLAAVDVSAESNNSTDKLPPGPYFLRGQNLHQAWRLYTDDLDSFLFGMIPQSIAGPDSFHVVAFPEPDGVSKTIPVPSRHYHRPTASRPLAGVRISLKDTYDVKGIKTALSSKAWLELYPPPADSAAYVDKLIKLGAVIVGKTKTTQFSASAEWVDFQSPTNPRGDRYQEPSGSSTGAAASLAGYEWLDFAVGGDSDGDVRDPATYHGLYGIRPSFGSSSLQGVHVNSPRYDTAGLFARSLGDLYLITKETLDVAPEAETLSKVLLYPTDFFPLPDQDHQALFEEFVRVLERYLGVRRMAIRLDEAWAGNPPAAASNQSLQKYMAMAPFWSLCYDYCHQYEEFQRAYGEAFGKEPFVEAGPRFRWKVGAEVGKDQYEDYLTRIEVFREWFDGNIMTAGSDGHSPAIMVLPYGTAGPKYRDVPADPPVVFKGIDSKLLSPVLETPQLVVPFAQLPYHSRISGRREYRPISASVMGAKGSDLMLVRLVDEAFKASGWPRQVQTGRYTFSLGKNSRHVREDGRDTHDQILGDASDQKVLQ